VEHLVTIKQADIFTLDLREANVVTLYLLPSLNVKLMPQLEKLKPGSRIVSHDFDMRGAKPVQVFRSEESKAPSTDADEASFLAAGTRSTSGLFPGRRKPLRRPLQPAVAVLRLRSHATSLQGGRTASQIGATARANNPLPLVA